MVQQSKPLLATVAFHIRVLRQAPGTLAPMQLRVNLLARQKIVQLLEPLPPTWETQMELQLECGHWGKEPEIGRSLVSTFLPHPFPFSLFSFIPVVLPFT